MLKKTVAYIFCLILCACAGKAQNPVASPELPDRDLARQALADFFNHLHAGQYEKAVHLYGGNYEMMNWNPEIDPDDHASLMQEACTVSGIRCLAVRSLVFSRQLTPNEFEFHVEFQNKDGSLFVRWPCCGERERDDSMQHVFSYRVIKTSDGKFLVMDMPPYAP